VFARKTVDGVLAAFRKTISDLTTVETEQKAEADRQDAIAMEALQRSAESRAEADRAIRVREKLTEAIL
jgi:hypothetical protein